MCDRFTDSTIVYQGYGRKVNIELINKLNKLLVNNLKPSLTILLDIDPLIGLKRSKKRKNYELRYENMPLSYHKRIRAAFKRIAKKNNKRVKLINANQDRDTISELIWSFVQKKIT